VEKSASFHPPSYLCLVYDYRWILCLVSRMGVRVKIVTQFFNGWFLLFVGLYLGQLAFAVNGWSTPLLRNYLGDVVSIPIFLHLITVSMPILLKQPEFKADWIMLISLWGMVSIVFEVVLPHYYERYTSDAWDVVAYSVGTAIAWIIKNR
jgi:ABC-type antimicrobial peptide transport system permease subunit